MGISHQYTIQCEFTSSNRGFARNFDFLNTSEGVKAHQVELDEDLEPHLGRELREDDTSVA
jgi:hypothetical protein